MKMISAYDRRKVLRGIAGGVAAAGATTMFGPAVHAAKPIKIGYVSPKSGPLAAFAEADDFVLSGFREVVKNGVKIGSQTYQVEVVTKDSQSNPNRAAEVAKELITRDNVGIIVVGATGNGTGGDGNFLSYGKRMKEMIGSTSVVVERLAAQGAGNYSA